MIWFTSDLHFGCDKLVKNTRPEFVDCDQHDVAMLQYINSVVRPNDRLIIIGDLCKEKPGRYRPKIRCKNIMYVLGNHDKECKIRKVFGGNVRWQYMVKCASGPVFCAHYAHFSWDRSHYGVHHAFGHWHSNSKLEGMRESGMPGHRSMDVGVDSAKKHLGEYRPFSEYEFFDLLKDKKGHENIAPEDKWYNRDYIKLPSSEVIYKTIQARSNQILRGENL